MMKPELKSHAVEEALNPKSSMWSSRSNWPWRSQYRRCVEMNRIWNKIIKARARSRNNPAIPLDKQ